MEKHEKRESEQKWISAQIAVLLFKFKGPEVW